MQTGKKYSGRVALYFEDQPEQVEAITDYLHDKLGFEVLRAESPKEAFHHLATRRLDLVILDVRILGGKERLDGTKQEWKRYGLYFLEELRRGTASQQTPKNVPVLVITCVVDTADVEKLEALGTSSMSRYRYLAKPLGLDALGEVGQAVDYLLSK
jgi:CheY-like chemotaxis protein